MSLIDYEAFFIYLTIWQIDMWRVIPTTIYFLNTLKSVQYVKPGEMHDVKMIKWRSNELV